MKYNAILKRRGQTTPVQTLLDFEIPDNLNDDQRMVYAASKLMKLFRVEIEPVEKEGK